MKFKGYVDVQKPLEVVAAYFIDPAYLKEYQDGFIRKEVISGQAGAAGTVSKMYYQYNKREMILTETVISNELPHSFEAHYHHKHMDNTMKCTFTPIDAGSTRYHYEIEYTRINWIMPKLIAILFPSMYRKQGEKWMQQFKAYVEKQ